MRRWAVAAALVALSLSALPAVAGPTDDLEGAEHQLQETRARLDRAREAYEAARRRLAELQGELARVEERLGEARRAASEARRGWHREQQKAERAADRLESRRHELSLHVSDTYRRGLSDAGRVWLSVISSDGSPHDVALAEQATERLLERDRQLIADAREEQRLTRAAREHARAAAREAEARHAEVEELVERQRSLLAQAREQEEERETVVEDLAADRAAQEELVAALRRQLASVEAVLTTPREASFDQADPAWTGALPGAGRRWAGEIDAAGARVGVDGRFLAALVWTESYFREDAISPAGAVGLTQLMPATAEMLGVDPHDPLQNLLGGARYLRQQLEAFWDLERGLAAYNMGPGAVSRAGGVPESIGVQLYVLSVLERWRALLG